MELDILFNHNGTGNGDLGSSGSIAAFYRANSLDTFVLNKHVTPWLDIDMTEEAEACFGRK
jgi:hypothetical protein